MCIFRSPRIGLKRPERQYRTPPHIEWHIHCVASAATHRFVPQPASCLRPLVVKEVNFAGLRVSVCHTTTIRPWQLLLDLARLRRWAFSCPRHSRHPAGHFRGASTHTPPQDIDKARSFQRDRQIIRYACRKTASTRVTLKDSNVYHGHRGFGLRCNSSGLHTSPTQR